MTTTTAIEDYKSILRKKFNNTDEYNIPGISDYINEIDSIYEDEYKNIFIRVYYRKNKDNLNKTFIKQILRRGSHVYKENKRKIIIHLLLTPLKKIFEPVLTAKNVNSGFTYLRNNEIFIFRKEDFPKVIIHELIHHDPYIHVENVKKENEIRIKNHFDLNEKTNFILNEAIVELWACLNHLFFISKEYKIPFKDLFEIELEYSLYKCNQIRELHIKEKQKGNKWYDDCNIFGYFICKTILLNNLNKLMVIYEFPYDNTKISDFIIENSKLPVVTTNPYIEINGVRYQRNDNSLCFMLLSDL